jgi:hypothetical protein
MAGEGSIGRGVKTSPKRCKADSAGRSPRKANEDKAVPRRSILQNGFCGPAMSKYAYLLSISGKI